MLKPRLKEFYRILDVIPTENDSFDLIIGYTKSTAHRIEADRSVLKLLALCDGESTVEELKSKMTAEFTDVTSDDIDAVLDELRHANLLEEAAVTTELTEGDLDRYSRHFVYYSAFMGDNRYLPQEKLKKSKVVLIGMGGIGSWVGYALAASGIGTIVGADHDDIELSNLTRQILYSEKTVGQKKVQAAKDRLNEFNSDVEFIPLDVEMTSTESVKEVIAGADFVVLSADKPQRIHYWVDEACYDLKIPYLNVGYIDTWGVVGPMTVPDVTSCLLCDMGTDEVREDKLFAYPELKSINTRSKAASFGPLNGLVSCVAAMDVIKYLTGYETPVTMGRRYLVNSGTMETEYQSYPKVDTCKRCGH